MNSVYKELYPSWLVVVEWGIWAYLLCEKDRFCSWFHKVFAFDSSYIGDTTGTNTLTSHEWVVGLFGGWWGRWIVKQQESNQSALSNRAFQGDPLVALFSLSLRGCFFMFLPLFVFCLPFIHVAFAYNPHRNNSTVWDYLNEFGSKVSINVPLFYAYLFSVRFSFQLVIRLPIAGGIPVRWDWEHLEAAQCYVLYAQRSSFCHCFGWRCA